MKNLYFIITLVCCGQLYAQDTLTITKTRNDAGLRLEPSNYVKFSDTIPAETEIAVIDLRNNLWLVRTGDKEGYISSSNIWKKGPMYVLLNQSDEERMIKRYGEEIGEKINKHQIWIGMTKNMLLDSKGRPQTVNSTESKYTNLEQWIYPSYYIYLEDGNVTTIQSSNN